jgi:hypothetical protein
MKPAPDLASVGRLPHTHDIGFHGEHEPPGAVCWIGTGDIVDTVG